MRRINFHKNGTGIDLILGIPMVFFAFLNLFHLFIEFSHPFFSWIPSDLLPIITYTLIFIYFGRFFIKKDVVFWNGIGANLKLGNWYPKSINYTDIRSIERTEKELIIKRLMSGTLRFDVSNYQTQDVDQLVKILHTHSNLYANRNLL